MPTVQHILLGLLAGTLATVGPWTAYTDRVVPLREGERRDRKHVADLHRQMGDSRMEIEKVRARQDNAAKARAELDRTAVEIPEGQPLVWVPGLVQDHFSRFGFSNPVTRQNLALKDPHQPGYQRIFWCAALPLQGAPKEVGALLTAVAEFEQANPIIRVVDLVILSASDETSQRSAAVTFSTLVRED
jgi:hypothetical protein